MTLGLGEEASGPLRIGVAVPDAPQRDAGRPTQPGSIPPPAAKPAPPRPGGGVATAALAVRARLDLFCEALGASLGHPVEAYGAAHYRELLDAMHDGKLDVAWLPPIIALRAAARGRTLPIAIPVRGGSASFSSALFTQKGSRFKQPSHLAGARAAWVDRQSAAGYLVIRATLRSQGHDLDRAFAAESFLGSHEAVVDAVMRGEADVGATFVTQSPSTGAIVRAGWGAASPHVIAFGGPIPSDVIAASIRVPVPMIRAVQRALCAGSDVALRGAASHLLGAESFVVPSAEHLDPLSRLLEYLDDAGHQGSVFPPPR